MVKPVIIILISFLVGFCATIFGYLYLPKQYIAKIPIHIPTPTPRWTTQFFLEKAPSESLKGTITSISGQVGWQSRTADSTLLITTDQAIQQGESVQTGNGTARVLFTNVLTANLEKNTQFNIIQTLPVQFVVQQTNGTISYEKTGSIPTSIRAMDVLLSLENGQITITVNKIQSTITATTKTGIATVAYTDTSNQTQTFVIKSGQKLLFDNDTREATIR